MATVLALLLVSGTAGIVAAEGLSAVTPPDSGDAVPADGPAYGVNNSTFQRLWSDDVDNGNLSVDDFDDANVSSRAEFAHRLARSTDVPFARPPQATSNWNSGDFGDYSPGGRRESVHPTGASLEDGVYIKDAYVSIFATQPSTILHHANGTTQYVAPDGQVRTISDYRIAVPQDDRNGSQRERWSIDQTQIESVDLSADGRLLDSASGHQATLQYTGLSGSPQLTVDATITVTLRHVTLDCPDWNSSTAGCDGDWNRDVETPEASRTVSTSQRVVVNRLSDIAGQARPVRSHRGSCRRGCPPEHRVVDDLGRRRRSSPEQLVVLHSESSRLADDGHEHRDQHVAGDIVGAPRPDSRVPESASAVRPHRPD